MVLRTYSWPITDERTYKAALRAAVRSLPPCGRLGLRLGGYREGWDLVGQLGRFAAEAPIPVTLPIIILTSR